MPSLFLEPVVGVTAYPSSPQVTASGQFEPRFHAYKGATAADFFVSYDGRNDAFRLPAGAALVQMPVSYKSVWLRSAIGVTAAPGISLITRQ